MNFEPISRPRVERALREAVGARALTLVRAPTGSGKTVAAAAAFGNESTTAWLDARPWHRGAYVRALVAAVRGVRDDFGRMTLGTADAGASDAHVGTTFARELAHRDDALTIVVDNVEVFEGDAAFARFVDAVASATPPRAHVLLVGRAMPEIPARLFAREIAHVVEDEGLAFDEREVAALAQRFDGVADETAAREILRATNGWAAGVALAVAGESVALRGAREPKDAEEDVGARLFRAEASRDSHEAAAFLRAHVDAVVAAGDRARVQSVAANIDPEGPDADVRWYTEGLLDKARGAQDSREKFARAAAHAANDRRIAFHARAQVVEYDIGHGVPIGADALDELERLAQALGSQERTMERTLRGWSLAVKHDFSGALAAVGEPAAASDAGLRFHADILRAYALTALGECDAAEETLDALVAYLERDDRVVLQTLTLIWFARLALVWGNTNVAADVAAQAERLAGALDLRAEEAALYGALAEIATHAGDAVAATRYAECARGRAERAWYAADVRRVRAFAEVALARAAFLAGDAGAAFRLARRAMRGDDVPSAQVAVAAVEAAAYAGLAQSETAGALQSARAALAAAIAVDAADAAALTSAEDLLAFLDAVRGDTHDSVGRADETFAALARTRRGLVTLEYAGVALRGASESAVFDNAIAVFERNGPRFEARLARAYVASHGEAAAPKQPDELLELTPREREILVLLAEGLTNKEMAARLVVSPRTVETHVERVLGKLEVASRSRAIAKALRLGLVRL